jgi:4'-phosphopantetheinyl transferase
MPVGLVAGWGMRNRRSALDQQLASADVDVWLSTLDCSTKLLQTLARTLSVDEAERASRFRCAPDRARFTAARGILRCILSSYVGCGPEELRFAYQPGGKPHLEQTGCTSGDWRFNLSHSGTTALYAITRGREVGVDIELIRRGILWESIATRFFSVGEVGKLQRWPAKERPKGFFTCWTRKEAYLKAAGVGLSVALDRFEVSAGRREVPALLGACEADDLQRWSFWDVPLNDRLAGTVVTEGCPRRLRLLRFVAGPLNFSPTVRNAAGSKFLGFLYPQERP